MYRALVESNPTHNLVFSPINAASSLAMIFLGARWARVSTHFRFYRQGFLNILIILIMMQSLYS
jgi:hypothetical protein